MANAMKEEAQRATRTVLDIQLVDWQLDGDGNGPDFLTIKARNIGEGPALNISAEVPNEPEIGFPGGIKTFGSIGAGQESMDWGIAIKESAITLDYSDVHNNKYRSSRLVLYEEYHSAISLDLDVLRVESVS